MPRAAAENRLKRVVKTLKSGEVREHFYCRETGVKLGNTRAEAEQTLRYRAAPIRPKTMGELVKRYRADDAFLSLAPRTRSLVMGRLRKLEDLYGHLPLFAFTRQWLEELKRAGRAHPFATNGMISTLRVVFDLGLSLGCPGLTENPAVRPKRLKTKRRRTVWTHEQERAFLTAKREVLKGGWTFGRIPAKTTKTVEMPANIRLAFLLALYTAQRLSDVISLKVGQLREATDEHGKVWLVVRLQQQKTGEILDIPLADHVAAEVREAAAGQSAESTIVRTVRGRPFDRRSFNRQFVLWREAAEISSGVQFRDLRRTAMVRLGEMGVDIVAIAALSGHSIAYCQDILETYLPRNLTMAFRAARSWNAARSLALPDAPQEPQDPAAMPAALADPSR
jgi:integrase